MSLFKNCSKTAILSLHKVQTIFMADGPGNCPLFWLFLLHFDYRYRKEQKIHLTVIKPRNFNLYVF